MHITANPCTQSVAFDRTWRNLLHTCELILMFTFKQEIDYKLSARDLPVSTWNKTVPLDREGRKGVMNTDSKLSNRRSILSTIRINLRRYDYDKTKYLERYNKHNKYQFLIQLIKSVTNKNIIC
jgi:hypothetical protein